LPLDDAVLLYFPTLLAFLGCNPDLPVNFPLFSNAYISSPISAITIMADLLLILGIFIYKTNSSKYSILESF